MFDRDPLVPLSKLIEESPRYLGNQDGVLNLEVLQNMLQMAATQIDLTRKHRDKDGSILHNHKLKANYLVMVRDKTSRAFEPNYKKNYRVVKFLGKNQLQVVNTVTTLQMSRSSKQWTRL